MISLQELRQLEDEIDACREKLYKLITCYDDIPNLEVLQLNQYLDQLIVAYTKRYQDKKRTLS